MNELEKNRDDKNAIFLAKLCPNYSIDNILGIKIPVLRKMAKEICKEKDINKFLDECNNSPNKYMEELILEGLVIGYSKIEINEKLDLIKKYIPKINNWIINDTFCPTIKVKEKDLSLVWKFIKPYLKSKKEFEVRFGVIMMLDNFIVDKYVDEVINEIDKIKNNSYYAEMAMAWTLAEVGIKYYDKLMNYLTGVNNLSNFTYNKTLQKMIESYRITNEQKDILKSMKRTIKK